MRWNNLKPGEQGPNNNDQELSSIENYNDLSVIWLEGDWDMLAGKVPLQTRIPPAKMEGLLLFKQGEAQVGTASAAFLWHYLQIQSWSKMSQ